MNEITVTLVVLFIGALLTLLSPEIRHRVLGERFVSAPADRTQSAVVKLGAFAAAVVIVTAVVLLAGGVGRRTFDGSHTGKTDPSKRARPAPATSSMNVVAPVPARRLLKEVTFVDLPGGAVVVGCLPNDKACTPAESSPHTTIARPFSIMTTEATGGAFRRCVADGACHGEVLLISDALPVTDLDASEAQDFCQWLGGRLPSEAEWEYAASGGDHRFIYPWGNEFDPSRVIGGVVGATLSPPATRQPNAFGLFDMSGNAAEWAVGPVSDEGKSTIVVRGGSYVSRPEQLRISYRVISDYHSSSSEIGVRCVADAL